VTEVSSGGVVPAVRAGGGGVADPAADARCRADLAVDARIELIEAIRLAGAHPLRGKVGVNQVAGGRAHGRPSQLLPTL